MVTLERIDSELDAIENAVSAELARALGACLGVESVGSRDDWEASGAVLRRAEVDALGAYHSAHLAYGDAPTRERGQGDRAYEIRAAARVARVLCRMLARRAAPAVAVPTEVRDGQ